ncbi:MAG: CoA transferase subunit A [Deltaproteobacteria bacterium]|nr:CoA transferase subunit A [Deltaproteobacteria bacterium]
MSKIKPLEEAIGHVKSGMTLHIGGFYGVGTPDEFIGEIIRHGIKDLTVVTNDSGTPEEGVGRLLYAGCIGKLILSWCGLTPIVPELVQKGKLELELTPQGTLAERIRAAGYGLGGVLTRTGLGTIVEEKGLGTRITVNGTECLYHPPLKADVTLTEAYMADKNGNLIFRRTQNNFNEVMCTAADMVIASVYKPIVEMGELHPDAVNVPGPLVDILVQQKGALS